jgi:hypothetical protein
MQASAHVPGAKGKLLDYYDWRLAQSDSGMLYLLHRNIPSATRKQTEEVDNGEVDDEGAILTDTATRSKSTIAIASAFIRAMHAAVVVLGVKRSHDDSFAL